MVLVTVGYDSVGVSSKLVNQLSKVMYRSNRSFNMHPPPPGGHTPGTFYTFAVPGKREFDYQSLPGGGEFELHPRFHVCGASYGGRGVTGFSWKRLCLYGQLVTRKGLKQAFWRI